MKKNLFACLVLSTALTQVACSTLQTTADPSTQASTAQQSIKSYFDEVQTKGVIVIKQDGQLQTYGNDLSRANTEYVPASTFKILNALIGLENHKVTLNEVFKWDGQKRSFPTWEKDMNLAEAMKLSAVPVYQELARRIGVDLMAQEVKRLHFGNAQIGTQVDNFWLVGPLKVTPVQEVEFVEQLAHKQLPFKPEVQETVQQMILLQEVKGNKIYAKSGWGMDLDPQVGWLTGWVEQPNGKKVAFSLNMEMKPKMSGSIRNEITLKALENLGVI